MKSLGLLWSREDLYSSSVRPDDETEEMLIPLSTLIMPTILESLRMQLKDTRDKKGVEVEMGKWSRKNFLGWYRTHTSMNT